MQKKQKIKDNPIAPRVCPAIPPPRSSDSNKSSGFSIIQDLSGSQIKVLSILQFVKSQKRKAGFSSFQPMHFGRIGVVVQIVTTKALN